MINEDIYSLLLYLYNYYNKALFQGILPDCLINICRKKGKAVFFTSKRWEGEKHVIIHEINLTPQDLELKIIEWHAVLVHNMVHLWQFVCGEPSRNGYHNTEFSSKMEEIGLNTFSVGNLGGKRTGQSISQNINAAGLFLKAFNKLPKKDFEYHPLPDLEDEKDKIANSATYVCPLCADKAWGKPGMKIRCDTCDKRFIQKNSSKGNYKEAN